MGVYNKIRTFIKKKSPATFNAAEYETERVLNRIDELSHILLKLDERIGHIEAELGELPAIREDCSSLSAELGKLAGAVAELQDISGANCQQINDIVKGVNVLTSSVIDEREQISKLKLGIDADSDKLDNICTITEELKATVSNQYTDIHKRDEQLKQSINKIDEKLMRSDLNAIVGCKSDTDFDEKLIPLNRYFDNRGMAISMHLTSVADKPDPIVYETADMIRTSALSLVADEIHARKLGGAVAELGVAQGKFARVINALFPEKVLHLFDTFEGFPEIDINVDKESNYSNANVKSYANIDMSALMSSMRYPEKCVFHKGYFPDTTDGLDEEFCFVNIDCDLYVPIKAGLEYFYPRLLKGGCIFVHDYRSKYFKGVRVAVNEFAEKYGVSYCVLPDNTGTAVIMK